MTRIALIFAAVCFFQLADIDQAHAQYGSNFYSPHQQNNSYASGYNTHHPATGYCLKNDCYGGGQGYGGGYGGGGYGQGYGGGYGGGGYGHGYGGGGYGYGGGCGQCGGSSCHSSRRPTITVRVTVGGQSATPTVQSYYPQIQNGCSGCSGYYGKNRSGSNSNQFVNRNSQDSRTVPATASKSSSTKNAGYRYKF